LGNPECPWSSRAGADIRYKIYRAFGRQVVVVCGSSR
jgi:hypothetical protein